MADKWTDEEIRILKEKYSTISNKELSKILIKRNIQASKNFKNNVPQIYVYFKK